MFLNTELEMLEVDDITDELKDILGQEYTLVGEAGNLKFKMTRWAR